MTMKPGALVTAEDVVPYPHRTQVPRGGDVVATYALVSLDKPYKWAIVAYQVGGWRCLAVGEMPEAPARDAVAAKLVANFGPGRDYLPREQFAVTRPSSLDVHLRRVVGEPTTYCNVAASNPYEYVQGRYYQHCMKCTTTYLAENFGRHPFEEH